MRNYVRTLTIAGSDSGGCAGIQADLKTFAALGCFGMSVITALTAQNTQAVLGVQMVDPAFIRLQMEVIFSDMGADGVKTGMLGSKAAVIAVAEELPPGTPLVVDPVMVASSGARLLDEEAVDVMKQLLFPKAALITPNIPEAEALLGFPIVDKADMENGARELLKWAPAVLLKGGHLALSDDCLVWENQTLWLTDDFITTSNTHGSGCTYSAALCAMLAKGYPLSSAALEAKKYLSRAIRTGAEYRIGRGAGPLYHAVTL